MALDSKAGIISSALLELGAEEVQTDPDNLEAADPNDDLAIQSFAIYETTKLQLFNKYPWSWALERKQLQEVSPQSTDANTQRSQYTHVYLVPEATIGNIRGVYQNLDIEEPALSYGWALRGTFIYADYNPLYAEYLRDVGEAAYPGLFISALVQELCHRFCLAIIQDPQQANMYRRNAMEALADATRVDSQSKPTNRVRRYRLVDAHYGGYPRYRLPN